METPIHPMIVHFPVALILTALFLDFVGIALKRSGFRDAAYKLLWLATLGAAVAAITGLAAHDQIQLMSEDLHDMVELHEALAFSTLATVIVALALRVWAERKAGLDVTARRLSFVFLFIAGVLVGITGNFGGKLVYKYGTGTELYLKAPPLERKTNVEKQNLNQHEHDNRDTQEFDWH